MFKSKTEQSAATKPLRLWPGVVLAILLVLVRFVVPLFNPEFVGSAVLYAMVGALLILLWWLFLSRAPWAERVGALLLMIIAMFVTSRFLHKSIATGGQGKLFYISAIPILTVGLVAWAVASRRLSPMLQRVSIVAAIFIFSGAWTLLRTEGVTGDFGSILAWRWTASHEEQLLLQPSHALPISTTLQTPLQSPDSTHANDSPATQSTSALVIKTSTKIAAMKEEEPEAASAIISAKVLPVAEWPGFRGAERDGIVRNTRIVTDWATSPPQELWRKPIGPAWSSFAVQGEFFFTQEQRGEEEMVSCYKMSTGEPVWIHRDSTRFWESNGGAGPRATPTLHHDRVYTFGGTGIVNALNAQDGSVIWSRNASVDAKKKIPGWGFAGSPLVFEDKVIIAAGGKLVAYDLATGTPLWFGPDSGWGYASPHLLTIDGVAQVVLLDGQGAISVAPENGELLWKHHWPGDGILQPVLTAEGDFLIATGSGLGDNVGIGVRRLAIKKSAEGWKIEERWTSNGLKPYFNDFVVHKDHAFGFDGSILACINLADGKRKWKGGRYGHGQLVLLPEQDLLLVLSEQGELALVQATAEQFTEVARMPSIKGKTWNHPVLVGDILLVRNGVEMVAYRVARTGV